MRKAGVILLVAASLALGACKKGGGGGYIQTAPSPATVR